MLKYGGRRRREMPATAQINITNLVDVAFVLLIIFMITAPIMQGGIDVQLATAEAQPLEQADPIVISITADGEIFVGEAEVADLDELEIVLGNYVSNGDQTPIVLKPDEGVVWDRVAPVMGRLQKLGIVDVGFIVEPERGT